MDGIGKIVQPSAFSVWFVQIFCLKANRYLYVEVEKENIWTYSICAPATVLMFIFDRIMLSHYLSSLCCWSCNNSNSLPSNGFCERKVNAWVSYYSFRGKIMRIRLKTRIETHRERCLLHFFLFRRWIEPPNQLSNWEYCASHFAIVLQITD